MTLGFINIVLGPYQENTVGNYLAGYGVLCFLQTSLVEICEINIETTLVYIFQVFKLDLESKIGFTFSADVLSQTCRQRFVKLIFKQTCTILIENVGIVHLEF